MKAALSLQHKQGKSTLNEEDTFLKKSIPTPSKNFWNDTKSCEMRKSMLSRISQLFVSYIKVFWSGVWGERFYSIKGSPQGSSYLSKIILFCAWGAGVCFPLFKAPTNILFYSMLVLSLFLKEVRKEIPKALGYWPVKMGLVLLGLFAIGLFYTPEAFSKSFRIFLKYARFGLPLFLIPFFAQKRHVHAFMRGLATSAFVCIVVLGGQKLGHFESVHVINPIYTSFILSIAALFWLIGGFEGNRKQFIFVAAVATVLLFVLHQRTGILIFGLNTLCLSLFYFFFKKKKSALGILLCLITIPLVGIKWIDAFRFVHADWTHILEKKEGLCSVSFRFEFIKQGIKLAKKAPFFGHGTGAYSQLHLKNNIPYPNNDTPNPHNTYVHILVELGLVGLTALLLWQGAFFQKLRQRSLPNQLLLLFLTLSICIGFLSDTMLFINSTRDFTFSSLSIAFIMSRKLFLL